MKINKLVEHTEIIHHEAEYDEQGQEITPAYDEEVKTYTAENVEATEEEQAEYERQQEEEEERQRTAPPTDTERISCLEDVILELLGGAD